MFPNSHLGVISVDAKTFLMIVGSLFHIYRRAQHLYWSRRECLAQSRTAGVVQNSCKYDNKFHCDTGARKKERVSCGMVWCSALSSRGHDDTLLASISWSFLAVTWPSVVIPAATCVRERSKC